MISTLDRDMDSRFYSIVSEIEELEALEAPGFWSPAWAFAVGGLFVSSFFAGAGLYIAIYT